MALRFAAELKKEIAKSVEREFGKMRLLKKREMTINDEVLYMLGKPYGEIKKVWGKAERI